MKKSLVIMILLSALILGGCASKKEDSQVNTDTTSSKQEASDKTETDKSTKDENSLTVIASPTPKKVNLILPVTQNDTGKVLIQTVSASRVYLYNSYIITSKNGESVVVDPTEMPDKSVVDINPAAILCTHSHEDHVDNIFSKAYDVPKLMYEEKEIKTKDFNIFSIASSHNSDTIDKTNFIIVMEVDGLRIAHMGDIGQTFLTKEQLEKLGEIDIAFMQFDNSYSSMTVEKAVKLMEQLNPKIIIPTHYRVTYETKIKEIYGDITEADNILEITKEDLPEKSNIYKILNTHKYK